jgi:transposase, IS5 family
MSTLQPGVDQEARWVKKGSKLQYGYKRHYLAEAQESLVIAVHTTPANVHDSQLLGDFLNKVKLPPRSRVLADKGTALRPMRRCSTVRACVAAYSAKPTGICP